MPDELEMRLRQLEAERLRPVPERLDPPNQCRITAFLAAIRRDYEHHHEQDQEAEGPI